ncbi:MAG: hypothetical protein KIS78_35580 [Labilithrix sp.]|nr:hypothetical protein [Labilithrix sp.]
MTKLPEVELAALAKIAPDALRLLWVNDGRDGRLEAVVEHAGQPCLMVLHDEGGPVERPYRWLLVHLTPEQRAEEERWHALFVEHVGDHWCFHGETLRHAPPSPEPDPTRFYDAYRERRRLDVSTNAVLGWADEMPAR